MVLATGAKLGPYEILAPLGVGGMGEVYRARDTRLGRNVAIKVLPLHLSSNPDLKVRFEREARAISALNHPHICHLYDIGSQDGVDYLVMELLEGGSLAQCLARDALSVEEILTYAIQISEALDRAHGKGVVHRDLKPGNVILTRDGVKLLDFGLATLEPQHLAGADTRTVSHPLTEPHTTMGTIAYMSPEQARGEQLDARTDLFSFGAVLYEMATCKRPFTGNTAAVIFDAILHATPTPAARLNSKIPQELERIVAKAMQKERELRYQAATEISSDLKRLKRDLDSGQARRAVTLPARKAARHSRIRSLAVLPLVDLSHDDAQAYFADGMTEALITDLAKVGALRVISRTSAMRYKGANKPLPEIARELGVDAIVEGSVLRTGRKVRITAQLIEAASDTHIWAENYDRNLEDILSLQGEVAQAIAKAVQAKLTPDEKRRLATRPVVSPEAHELYLKGRHFWNQRGLGLKKAIEFFQRALDHSPTYSPAYAGLADSYALLGFYGFQPPLEAMPKAKQAASKALALDPALAEAHASLGYIHTVFDWEWEEAEKEFQAAFKLNLGYGPARYWHSILLFVGGRWDDSISELKLGLKYDPMSVYMQAHMGVTLFWAGRWAESAEQCMKALEWDPNFLSARAVLGASYYFMGRVQEGIRELQAIVETSGRDSWAHSYLGAVYASAGNRTEAGRIVKELENRRKREYISAFSIATVYAALAEIDKAFEWLEAAYQERASFMFGFHRHPFISSEAMRRDRRFTDLMQRVGVSL